MKPCLPRIVAVAAGALWLSSAQATALAPVPSPPLLWGEVLATAAALVGLLVLAALDERGQRPAAWAGLRAGWRFTRGLFSPSASS